MVLMNAGKRSRHVSSITNTGSGGGSKKAGLHPVIGLSSWGYIAYNTHGLPLSLLNLRKNRFSKFPNMNLPLGFNPTIRMH
jgi:hypothetical protein